MSRECTSPLGHNLTSGQSCGMSPVALSGPNTCRTHALGPHCRAFMGRSWGAMLTMWRSLHRIALILIAVFWLSVGSPLTRAQDADELSGLNKQVEQLYDDGKYSEATEIAKRALALAERQF